MSKQLGAMPLENNVCKTLEHKSTPLDKTAPWMHIPV